MEDDLIATWFPGADPRRAEVRIGWEIASAEHSARSMNTSTAELWRSIYATISEARANPEVFVPMVEHIAVPTDIVEYAERSAVADLAVRLGFAEGTIRQYGANASTLNDRTPRIWADFLAGSVSVANARIVADLAMTLPDDSDFVSFETQLVEWASKLAPARFRTKARAVRERVHSVPLLERHRLAAQHRRVFLEHGVDGMSILGLALPAQDAQRAYLRLDAHARDLASADDETRTLDQLRADTAADLLIAATTDNTPAPVGVTVGVTVPVMTLLGGDEPAELEGYGPIDAETARCLVAPAPSFFRILTHPISGTVLDVDRTSYRVPADLKRRVRLTHPLCGHPGCGRRAVNCDIDHVRPFGEGKFGKTAYRNLIPLCRLHHRLKSVTRWQGRPDDPGEFVFTSPTGFEQGTDPPPF